MGKRLIGKQSERKRLRTKQTVETSAAASKARTEEPAITAAASKYDDIIKKIYYDVKEGFGSVEDTWKAAKKQDPTITKAIVKEFLDKQAVRQTKKEPKWNSWVPREALQTIQMDIAHMPKRIFGQSEFEYALFAYDVVSKSLR